MELRPKRSLGQNFLVDKSVVEDLVKSSQVKKTDTVLEVGAGTGAVTKNLARLAGKVIAVEFDSDLIPTLKTHLRGIKNVEVVNADVLDLDPEYFRSSSKIVGAIPYQITSPLIHKILHSQFRPKSITFIVQKEVAEKIAATPPDATYLSNFVANFGEARIIKVIKPGAFSPQPKVDSAIIHIELYPKPKVEDTLKLEKFLHHGFAQAIAGGDEHHPLETGFGVHGEHHARGAEINPHYASIVILRWEAFTGETARRLE